MPNHFPKIALILSLTFLLCTAVAFSLLYRKINDNNGLAQQQEAIWQNESARRGVLSLLDRSIKVIEPQITQMKTHFAQSSDVVPFLDSIERLATMAGVGAEVASVDVPAKDKVLVVTVNTSGGFGETYKFLTLLENSPYQLDFVAVDLKRKLDPINPLLIISNPVWVGYFKFNLISFVK